MKRYVVLRRCGWPAIDDLREAAERFTATAERMSDDIGGIRSYVLSEPDGSVGTVCIYEATSPEVIRAHAEQAGWPLDEIVAVADTIVVRSDPVSVSA